MESIWVFGIYHPFISVVCFPYGSTIDERMHCSDCFQYAVQYFIANMWSIWGPYSLVRYMLCICSACRQDMGKHVCIPATLFRHCRPIWLPYGNPYECLVYTIHLSLLYAFQMAQQQMNACTVLTVSNMLCNILSPTCDLCEDCVDY